MLRISHTQCTKSAPFIRPPSFLLSTELSDLFQCIYVHTCVLSLTLCIFLRKYALTILIVLHLAFFYFAVFSCKPESFPIPSSNCRFSRPSGPASPARLAPPPVVPARPDSRPTSRASQTTLAPAYRTKGTVAVRSNRPWGTSPPGAGRGWGVGGKCLPFRIHSAPLQVGWESLDAGECLG